MLCASHTLNDEYTISHESHGVVVLEKAFIFVVHIFCNVSV